MARHQIDIEDAKRVYGLEFIDVRGHAMTPEPIYEYNGSKLYIGVPKSPVVWKYGMPFEMPMVTDASGVLMKTLGFDLSKTKSPYRSVNMYFVQLNDLDWGDSWEAILSLPSESTHMLVMASYRAAELMKGGLPIREMKKRPEVKPFGKARNDDKNAPYLDFMVVRLTDGMRKGLWHEEHEAMYHIAEKTKSWSERMAKFYRERKEVAWQMNELSSKLHEKGWRTVFYQNSMDVVVVRSKQETAINFRFARGFLRALEDVVKRGEEALEPAFWNDEASGSFPILDGTPAVTWYRL